MQTKKIQKKSFDLKGLKVKYLLDVGLISQYKPKENIDFRSSHVSFAGKQFRGSSRKERTGGD